MRWISIAFAVPFQMQGLCCALFHFKYEFDVNLQLVGDEGAGANEAGVSSDCVRELHAAIN